MALSRNELIQAVHENLKHLGLDVLDLVNLRVGGFDRPTPGSIAEPFTVLAQLQQEGIYRVLTPDECVALAEQQGPEGKITMHPLLALQLFIGPIFFHILTRPFAERVLSLDIDGETAVTQLAESWLRAMVVKEEGDG